MNVFLPSIPGLPLLLALTVLAHSLEIPFPMATAATADDSRTIKKLFKAPPRSYATAPLWVWNDNLTEPQIRQTLRDLAGQKVQQAFVHPRPGLMTPYLSNEWFRLWRIALDEAAKLDMNLWIYDENSYPSGFAGGWVPETMPAARGRGLQLQVSSSPPTWSNATLEVFRLDQDQPPLKITAAVRNGAYLPDAQYLTASVIRADDSPWHGNRSYVDLLYPGVTEQFLETTLEAYRREVGDHFGSRIPGIFSDEPHILPAGGLPWTDDLPEQFMRRWGYSLSDHLPSLTLEIGDWRRVRHNYFQVLLELFIERWAKPYYERAQQYGLEFTGHYWEHEWPNCLLVPDNMALAAWQHRPGIDTLMNRYEEHTHAQFGNVRAVREISSIANQLGRKRTLCELYGAGGWDLRFEDMKRIGDWLAVLGVNTFDEHLSYISLRGARKRDHPQSFSYHEPWWDAYHLISQYLSRLSLALSHGRQINPTLVLEPTSTAWMYNSGSHSASHLKQLGQSFSHFLLRLESQQVEYDLGCEDVMTNHGTVQNRLLQIGQAQYQRVILPPGTENLNSSTVTLLAEFLRQGGSILATTNQIRVNGASSDAEQTLTRHRNWQTLAPDEIVTILAQPAQDALFTVTRTPGDRGLLFHQRRYLSDGQLLFLVNTSLSQPSTGSILARAGAIEQWDLVTGDTRDYPWYLTATGIRSDFELPPSGSLLLFLPNSSRKKPSVPQPKEEIAVAASSPMRVQRLGPNVLTIDYVTITAGNQTLSNSYFYAASQFAFRQNGMDRNPWDSAVQFGDELRTRTFPADSGFTATYTFTIADTVPAVLEAVVERPDLYTITCNGKMVVPSPGRWWLDREFGRLNLERLIQVGTNEITLRAVPFRIEHELEPIYLLGTFALRATDRGYVLAPDQSPTSLTSGWNQQGHPFYAEGVSYQQTFNIKRKRDAYRVALGNWRGSVARIFINQKQVGHIFAPPWTLDVTPHIRRGHNQIEVQVVGTLKNTLGPHHGQPGVGSAWPSMFHQAPEPGPPPGNAYHTIDYGLFEPFALVESATKP